MLPKLSLPSYTTTLPSTGQVITFRPFVVREEKLLLMAAESKDTASMAKAMQQVVQDCLLTEGIRVERLPFFDVEYLFLMLRAKSVGEKVKLGYRHKDNRNAAGQECKATYETEIDLEQLAVPVPDPKLADIPLPGGLTMRLRYPTLNEFVELDSGKPTAARAFDLLAVCLASVYGPEENYAVESREEARAWVEQLPHAATVKLNAFFLGMPTVTHTIQYACPGCKEPIVKVLKGTRDFF